jgi:hypothetical protein
MSDPERDRRLFGLGGAQIEALRAATSDLSWLLGRGYGGTAALKLVGDRYALEARQRTAVSRCACSDAALESRRARQLPGAGAVGARRVLVDGFNCVITLQTALGGGLVLRGRDRCYRDLASVHGSFRPNRHLTRPAIAAIGAALGTLEAVWYLDRPVSGSGDLRALLLETAREAGWPWQAELVADPDRVLVEAGADAVAATADSGILDRCGAWLDLSGAALESAPENVFEAWVVDLSLPLR